MQLWTQRTKNLVLLGVLLIGAVGVASVVTALRVEQNGADVSRTVETLRVELEQGDAGKTEGIPGSVRKTGPSRLYDGQRWIDVF